MTICSWHRSLVNYGRSKKGSGEIAVDAIPWCEPAAGSDSEAGCSPGRSAGTGRAEEPRFCLPWRSEQGHRSCAGKHLPKCPEISSSKAHVVEGHCCTWVVTYRAWRGSRRQDSGEDKYKRSALTLHRSELQGAVLYMLCTKMGRRLIFRGLLFWGNECGLTSVVPHPQFLTFFSWCDQPSWRGV